MVSYTSLLSAFCTLALASGSAASTEQIPLRNSVDLGRKQQAVIDALEDADIIPSILQSFTPVYNLNVSWPKASTSLGNTLDPAHVQSRPNVTLTTLLPDLDDPNQFPFWNLDEDYQASHLPQLTIALTDPDAPSHKNPEWSQICHWISTSFHSYQQTKEVMPWKPPGPPPKTGKHRYLFVAMLPINGTREELALRKPEGRQHWGYEGEGEGLGKWMGEMGLGVVGANFMYAQNEEQ